MRFGSGSTSLTTKLIGVGIVSSFLFMLAFTQPALGSDLGAAKSFAVLSATGDVTFKNRVNINQVSGSTGACPGSVGCPGSVAGTTVLMGRGNAAAPDLVSGDVIGTASASQGLNCAGNAPGSTAICLGNDSEVAGTCVTGGGAISSTSECAGGSDTSGGHPDLTTLFPQANTDAAAFAATLAGLAVTQTLPAVTLRSHGSATISTASGLNVISLPSITTGTNSTITINGGAADTVVINLGSSAEPGSLQLGNGASVVLSGGITPDHVIFNLLGNGASAQLGNNTTFNGTILGSQAQFTAGDGNTPSPVVINGALLFGGSISLGNNTNLNFYPFGSVTGGGTTSTSTTASQI